MAENNKLDFKEMKKRFEQAQEYGNTNYGALFNALGAAINKLKGENGITNAKEKLKTEKGQKEFFNTLMKELRNKKNNPYFTKINGESEEISNYRAAKEFGLSSFDIEKEVYKNRKELTKTIQYLLNNKGFVANNTGFLASAIGVIRPTDSNIEKILNEAVTADTKKEIDKTKLKDVDKLTDIISTYLSVGKKLGGETLSDYMKKENSE